MVKFLLNFHVKKYKINMLITKDTKFIDFWVWVP
jgi:hypothetical protein